MKRILLFAVFIVLCFCPGTALGQTAPIPDPPPLTEGEKAEIRAFTKDFLARLRRTRDVRPLIPRYFANDFETFVYYFTIKVNSGSTDYRLPDPTTRKRAVVAMQNQIALVTPYTVRSGLGDDFEKDLPPRLRRQWERYEVSRERVGNESFPLSDKQILIQMESLNRAFAAHLRAHPIEKTRKYKTQLKKREAIDDYNYSIQEDVPDRDFDEPAAEWIRSQPDARTYMVGTPHGLAVGILRFGGQYKVLYLFPWPMTYDPALH